MATGNRLQSMDLLRALFEAAAGHDEHEADDLDESGNSLRAAALRNEAARLRTYARAVAHPQADSLR